MKVRDITGFLEEFAPLSLQESYDNCGLLTGNPETELTGILICLDVTAEVLEEALENNCNIIISHHPFIFQALKKLSGNSPTERLVTQAVKNDLAVYAAHTNLDNHARGLNHLACQKLGLNNLQVLAPARDLLRKLVTFVPSGYAPAVRDALFGAGAGKIGNYDSCSYNLEGKGSFRGLEGSDPFVGEKGVVHFEEEVRIETIFPVWLEKRILDALFSAHPYEEVAYDIYPLSNPLLLAGAGMTGILEAETDEKSFLEKIRTIFHPGCIRHTGLTGKPVKKVAVCTGSGAFLIPEAIRSGAQFFITGDMKYHDFFLADNKLVVAEIGHYESEVIVKELIYHLLIEKFPNFALRISKRDFNPVHYF